ncbi:Origin recognition complex subunit Orc4 [Rasamsonia emersonii CBS 393.64]|uniref:Origin recognition complex subunit 4 n=1 Tax=Rasamsonia emersonii (strain ATCC 16479 / CBS 393.64 / IMI 116815) TaxID=1408163 RepID=A0A0F4Z3K0_RASE3|nr:Origin recognition complex subunit Orc4 [Rasamsonia emersonii CBS 393.64]KKA24463.1 Origin recognition complex subunit Orc4 [Rasamsonia emersonii CBS 393.64]
MVELRAAKRRKVSGVQRRKSKDNHEDDDEQDVYDEPYTPSIASESERDGELMAMDIDGSEEADTAPMATPKASGRRSGGRQQRNENDTVGDEEANTPSRTNIRSSARQRNPPQRYGDEVAKTETPRSSKRSVTAPSQESRSTRSTRKSVRSAVETEIAGDKSSPASETGLSRRRSKRLAVSFSAAKDEGTNGPTAANKESDEGPEGPQDSPLLNGHDVDDDDLVAAQLQHDLTNDVDGHDEPVVTADTLPDYAEQFQSLCEQDLREELGALSKLVMKKLSGRRLVPLKGLQTEYQKVYQLIEQTVTAGEGNSMLLMGSRGCGKTTMVESIISSLSESHKDEFHVVRLNGFLHTDDRLALREIWRQLGRETHTEDEAAKINSYADTMATLLALLSHPEELFGKSGNSDAIATAKSVVIILDEFDLFAAHSRQTLLYNLFDIAQAKKAPLAVIGLTTKVDVTEALEKRVKSRFSHRYVFLPLARTFETFSEICFAGLSFEDGEIDKVRGDDEEVSLLKSAKGKLLLEGWNNYLKTKSVKDFFSSALLPLSALHHSTYKTSNGEPMPLEIPTPKAFTSQQLTCPDPAPLPFVPSTTGSASTTSLPLSLLLAASRLTALHDPGADPTHPQGVAPLALSFPAAYAEYVRLLTSAKANASASGAAATPGRVWGRDVAREAWEKLVSWGLVVPLGTGNGTTDGRMFRVEVSFEEVAEMVGAGGSLGRWWRET